MVEFVGVIIAHEVPGLDEVCAVEESDIKAGVVACPVEIVSIGVGVNVKGMTVIFTDDGELEDLHFLEQV